MIPEHIFAPLLKVSVSVR